MKLVQVIDLVLELHSQSNFLFVRRVVLVDLVIGLNASGPFLSEISLKLVDGGMQVCNLQVQSILIGF